MPKRVAWPRTAPRIVAVLVACVLLIGATGDAAAQTPATPATPGSQVQVPLTNGDTLTGTLVETTPYSVTIQHPVLGWVTLPATSLALPDGAPLSSVVVAPPPPPPPPEPEVSPEPPSPWSGLVEVGLTGSSGNTKEQNLRVQLALRHKDEDGTFDTGVLYNRETSDSEVTADRTFLEGRYTWDVPDSNWGPFAQATYEDDRFKDFDNRISAGGGAAYTHRDDDEVRLVTRYGLGLVQTNGGEEDGTSPEGILGADYEQQINATTRFVSMVELLPDLSELGEWRGRASAAVEWNLDAANEWMLRLGAASEYDSTPGDAKSTDVDYFMTLGRKF